MAKPIKIVLAVIGVLLILLIGAVFAAAALFDPNDYRGKITETVKKQTGRDLALGDIQLSLFPWLKVRVADVSFSNAAGFGDTPMAQVKEARVGVQLLPLLLHRQVQVSTVTLDGLRLDLAKDAGGKTNWDDLVKSKATSAEEKKDEGQGVDIERIDIAGVTLTNADIRYRDAQADQSYHLEKVQLETGALRPGQPIDIETSLTAHDLLKKQSADLAFSATVLADMVAQKATVDELKFDIKARGEGLDATARLVGDIAADLANKKVDVSGMTLDFKTAMKDLQADGKLVGKVVADLNKQLVNVDGLKLDFRAKTPTLEAKGDLAGKVQAGLETKRYQVDGLALNADTSGSAVPGGKQSIKLGGDVVYEGDTGALRFNRGKIAAAGLAISTTLTGEGLTGDTPRLSGPIAIAPFNPRALLKTLGQEDIKTTDPKVLSTASLSARYSGSFKSARFDDLKLALDQTHITGALGVRDFATQAIEFALKVDRIDADRYLAPPEKPVAKPAAAQSTQQLNATELPIDALEKLNATGTLEAGELKLKGATLKNVQIRIDGPKGSAKVVQLDANAYGGKIATKTRVVPGARPDYALNTTIDAMQLAPMLQNFWGKDIVSGLGNIKLDLTSAGKTVGDVRRSLNGTVALNFSDGAVKGFNLAQIVRQGQALLKGTTYTATEPQQTDFTTITFAAHIVNGILTSDDLSALSPLFRLGGNGQINLVDETLNYLVSPTIVATSKGQGGKGLEELAGLTIPIKLTGSLYQPKYKLDLQTALKQKAGDELRGKLADKVLGADSDKALSDTELKQKAGEKLNEEIGRGLDKLFGGGSKKKKKDREAEAAAPGEGTAPAEATPPPAAETETPPADPATP